MCAELCEWDGSVLFIFRVSCLFCLLIFTLPRLTKVAQLCPSSRHNFVYCSSKVTVSSACMTAFGQNIIAMMIIILFL